VPPPPFLKKVLVVTHRDDPILQYFSYVHLPEHLQAASKPIADVAFLLADTLPHNAERAVALRKLLEAKDAAVRALVAKEPGQ
jgi:hypothetical protein